MFFKYLKKKETNRKNYHTLQELYTSVFEYIEGYYNSRRPHSSQFPRTSDPERERKVILGATLSYCSQKKLRKNVSIFFNYSPVLVIRYFSGYYHSYLLFWSGCCLYYKYVFLCCDNLFLMGCFVIPL